MLGDEGEVLDHRFHGRIVAAAFFQLKREAFRNGASHDARRLEALANLQHSFDIRFVGAEILGNIFDGRAEIAAIIGLVDQARRNQAVSRGKTGQLQLVVQVLVQCHIGGRVGRHIEIVTGRPCPNTRPVCLGGGTGDTGRHRIVGTRARLVDVLTRGIQLFARLAHAGAVVERHLFPAGRLAAFGGAVIVFGFLEQRVPLDLCFDELGKFLIGKLQQLDRLLQLRRHNQGCPLAHVE
jgi:hypothetical protein